MQVNRESTRQILAALTKHKPTPGMTQREDRPECLAKQQAQQAAVPSNSAKEELKDKIQQIYSNHHTDDFSIT